MTEIENQMESFNFIKSKDDTEYEIESLKDITKDEPEYNFAGPITSVGQIIDFIGPKKVKNRKWRCI